MEKEFVDRFSSEWVEAWNGHDLNRIMLHYADDFEMVSPVIQKIMNEPAGRLKGKNKIRAYWEKTLQMNPELHFDIINTCQGVNSIVIQYKGHRGVSAEMFMFNDEGKVAIAYAHYE